MGKRYLEKESGFCEYNDEGLDEFIEILSIIKENESWLFLEALTNFHDSLLLYDCNELTHMLYEFCCDRNIPVEIHGIKWKLIYGIETDKGNRQDLLSPILISEETRYQYNVIKEYSNSCYAFLKTIFMMNISLQAQNVSKKIFLNKEKKIEICKYWLPIEKDYVTYLGLCDTIGEQNVSEMLHVIKKVSAKKIVGILCNCQGEILFEMLKKQKAFLKSNFIILFPPLYIIRDNPIESICEDVFCVIDILVYQFVKQTFKWPFWATDNILQFLDKKCSKICLPDLYFDGYYPQITHIDKPTDILLETSEGNTLIQVRDYYIEEVYYKTNSIKKTIEILRSEASDFFNEEAILLHWNSAIERMLEKEKVTDLKMSDYILGAITEKHLFTAAHNPVNELMYVEMERLMKMLSIPFCQFDYNNMLNFGGAQQVIYPRVKSALGLRFGAEEFYANRAFIDRKYNLEEYIELYIRNICTIG